HNIISLYSQKAGFFLIKRKSDLIFVDNNKLRDTLVAKGFPADKLFITSMGIDKQFIESIP
ncbi:MAG: hypothetical protein GTO54_12065, partial [Nitrososphaeria archaeon]|nr:hypothetical protein [Nitrososphaeria archaeon]